LAGRKKSDPYDRPAMRFRIALAAVLVFAIVDAAQGFGLIGSPPTRVASASSRADVETVPAAAAGTTVTADPIGDAPDAPPATVAPPASDAPTPSTSPSTEPTVVPAAAATTRATPPDPVVARVVVGELAVYDTPGAPKPAHVLSATTEFRNPRVLLATQERDGWVQVMLPIRPNGSTGWVRASSVTLSTVPDVLDVDVAAHRLTWGRHGDVVLSVAAATGAPSSLTPLGTFFVTDVLPEDPGGAYGAWLLALDGHSDAFTEFDGGDARIAIHGTNDPSSIGRAASFGCVRVDADTLARLAAAIAPGTPVVIH
jgi:lipoprotein-anchoring transpeptidase ErfK/SrfK